ncbi:hypothetical protein Droror1_Dr00011463 [Drosera rotundifolia]
MVFYIYYSQLQINSRGHHRSSQNLEIQKFEKDFEIVIPLLFLRCFSCLLVLGSILLHLPNLMQRRLQLAEGVVSDLSDLFDVYVLLPNLISPDLLRFTRYVIFRYFTLIQMLCVNRMYRNGFLVLVLQMIQQLFLHDPICMLIV